MVSYRTEQSLETDKVNKEKISCLWPFLCTGGFWLGTFDKFDHNMLRRGPAYMSAESLGGVPADYATTQDG